MHGSQSQRGTQHVETADSTVRRLPGRVRVEDSGRTRQSRAVGPGGRPPPCPDAGPILGTVPVLGLYVPSLWVPLPRGVILTCGHQGRHSAWRLGWASDCLDLSTGLPVAGSAAQCEVRAQVCGGGLWPTAAHTHCVCCGGARLATDPSPPLHLPSVVRAGGEAPTCLPARTAYSRMIKHCLHEVMGC